MGDRHCEHEIAPGINPDITQAVLSTTDAFRKGPRYLFALMPRLLVKEQTQRSPLQRPSGSNHSAKQRLSTTRLSLSSDSSQHRPRHHIGGNRRAESKKLSLLNFANSKSLNVAGAKSAPVLELSCHQIAVRGTARLKSLRHDLSTVVSILSRSPGSQKNEAPFVFSTTGNIHILCPTPEASRTTMVPACTSASSTEASDPVLHRRRCAEAHGTRESHQRCHALGIRAEARSQCLPCRSFHSDL